MNLSAIPRIILLMVLVAGWGSISSAQNDWNISPDESLSISLNNLKDSAETVRQRNTWLKGEINRLEGLIERTKNQALQPKQKIRYRPSRVRNLERTARDDSTGQPESGVASLGVMPASAGESVLQERLRAKSGEENILLNAIDEAKREIQALRAKLDEDSVEVNSHRQMQKKLQAKLEVSQINIEELNRRLEDMEIEQGGVIGRYQALRKANNLHKQKQTLLETYLKDADGEKAELAATIKRLDSQNESFVRQIQGRIADLRSKGRNLEKVLDKATTKIRTNNIDFSISEQELEMLMENLTFIEQENKQLKSRYSRLESDWERLNETGELSGQ